MLVQIFFLVAFSLAVYVYHTLVYKPKKLMKYYAETLKSLGYTVKVYPFSFLGSGFIDELKQEQQKHNDPFYAQKKQKITYDIGVSNVLGKTTLEIYKPQLMQQFLGPKNPSLYYKVEPLIANIKRTLGSGIAFSQDSTWKHKRKIINSVFNYDFLQNIIPKIVNICNQNYERVQSEYFLKYPDQMDKGIVKMDVLQLFSCVFSNVMMECFFGVSSTYEKVDGQLISYFLNKLNSDISEQSFKPLSLILGVNYLKLGLTTYDKDINRRILILRNLAVENINKRLKQIKQNGVKEKYSDIIEALVVTNQLKIQSDTQLSDKYDSKELIDEFCTFYTAGTDTTSHFIQMMIYYMIQNPQVQFKLRQQISKVIKSDKDITSQNLKKLTYIDWIQNQTTRMYGPGTGIFVRYATKDHYLNDIPIKKDIGLTYQTIVNHYSEKYYKNPMEFNPQRWKNGLNQNHPYSFCGFSGGARSCIGKHLALLQSKIGLIKFCLRYRQFQLPKKNYKMSAKFLLEAQQMDLSVVKVK